MVVDDSSTVNREAGSEAGAAARPERTQDPTRKRGDTKRTKVVGDDGFNNKEDAKRFRVAAMKEMSDNRKAEQRLRSKFGKFVGRVRKFMPEAKKHGQELRTVVENAEKMFASSSALVTPLKEAAEMSFGPGLDQLFSEVTNRKSSMVTKSGLLGEISEVTNELNSRLKTCEVRRQLDEEIGSVEADVASAESEEDAATKRAEAFQQARSSLESEQAQFRCTANDASVLQEFYHASGRVEIEAMKSELALIEEEYVLDEKRCAEMEEEIAQLETADEVDEDDEPVTTKLHLQAELEALEASLKTRENECALAFSALDDEEAQIVASYLTQNLSWLWPLETQLPAFLATVLNSRRPALAASELFDEIATVLAQTDILAADEVVAFVEVQPDPRLLSVPELSPLEPFEVDPVLVEEADNLQKVAVETSQLVATAQAKKDELKGQLKEALKSLHKFDRMPSGARHCAVQTEDLLKTKENIVAQVAVLDARGLELERSITEVEKKIADAKEEILECDANSEKKLQEELGTSSKNLENLENELQKQEDEVSLAEEAVRKIKSDIDRAEIAKDLIAADRRDELKKDMAAMEAWMTKTKSEARKKRADLEERRKRLAAKKPTGGEKACAKLAKDIAALQKNLKSAKSVEAVKELRETVDKMAKEAEDYKRYSRLLATKKKLEEEYKRLKLDVDKLQRDKLTTWVETDSDLFSQSSPIPQVGKQPQADPPGGKTIPGTERKARGQSYWRELK